MSASIRRADVLLNDKPWLVFIFFNLLVVFLRWSSFYQSVLDEDESLYLLVAKAWSEGNPPYTTIWDNKPPVIYVVFLTAISILGSSILSIRIVACLFIAITCFFLYKMGSLIEHNGRGIGLLSGGLYAIATLSNEGMASNTEIFFTTFVVIAFYQLFLISSFHDKGSPSKKYLTLFLTGFLLGIGFEVKYVVLFDFLAMSLILVSIYTVRFRSNKKYLLVLQDISFLSLGFVLPFIIVSSYFWLVGHFDEYIYANFTANKLRTVDLEFSFVTLLKAIVWQFRANHFFWLSMPSVTIYLFIAKTIPTWERWILSSFIVWFLTNLLCIGTVLRGSFYSHYFLQLSPSLCLVTSYMMVRYFLSYTRFEQYEFRHYLIFGTFLIILINTTHILEALNSNAKYVYFRHIKGIRYWGDTPSLVAEYLKPKIKSNDYIYSVNQVTLYFLTDAKIPTRYVFWPFLIKCCGLPNITGIDPLEELNLILQKYPVYIVWERIDKTSVYYNDNKQFFEKLNQALDKSYHLENSIDRYDLYRLNTKPEVIQQFPEHG
jgi:hypothetical protein